MAPTSFADPVDLGGSLRPAVPKPGEVILLGSCIPKTETRPEANGSQPESSASAWQFGQLRPGMRRRRCRAVRKIVVVCRLSSGRCLKKIIGTLEPCRDPQ
mmetsp:Transcript_10115/g.35380  ORF Transcript_10115/g.35380 Transcript_10115/m.35380 type:complete len:101 (+) Transcript_10115:1677-1979(+)